MDSRAERAAEMYRAGAKWDVIGAALGTESKTIARLLRMANVPMDRSGRAGFGHAEWRAVQEPKREPALAMYRSSAPVHAILAALRIDERTLYRWRDEAGLPERQRQGEPVRLDLLATDEILAPGPGDWSLDRALVTSARRNAEIVANNYSGFPAI